MAWLVMGAVVRAGSAGEIIDRVLAVAAGDVITSSDVQAARAFDLVVVPAAAGGDPVRYVLTRLIDRALVLAEVERYASGGVDLDAIERGLQLIRLKYKTPEAFALALTHVGLDERQVKEMLRQNLRIARYLEERFAVAPPGDDEIESYYREHRLDFSRDGRVLPLDAVRADIVRATAAIRRQTLVDQWIASLRSRADIVDRYVTAR